MSKQIDVYAIFHGGQLSQQHVTNSLKFAYSWENQHIRQYGRFKKSRDLGTKRKNSIAGKNKEIQSASSPTSGSAASTPTTPTSAGSATSFPSFSSGNSAGLPPLRPTQEHVPVNNFNAQEVSNFLNNNWKEVLERLYDNSSVPEPEKPEMYKNQEKAWGSKSGSVWGQRGHLMANGNDFLAELRKTTAPRHNARNSQPTTMAK